MPYVKTGRPNGRPRKNPEPEAVEKPQYRRVRKEFAAPPKRRYVTGSMPVPFQAPADTSPPGFGQRKTVKSRGPSLHPTPLKA